eukprot:487820-Prymnesium_polylepis.1
MNYRKGETSSCKNSAHTQKAECCHAYLTKRSILRRASDNFGSSNSNQQQTRGTEFAPNNRGMTIDSGRTPRTNRGCTVNMQVVQ